MAPSKSSVTSLSAGASKLVRYQPVPTYGSPPVRPVFKEAFFSKFCVTATFCRSLFTSNGPKIAQSCGITTDSHWVSLNSGWLASLKSPLLNFQSFSSSVSLRCACNVQATPIKSTVNNCLGCFMFIFAFQVYY